MSDTKLLFETVALGSTTLDNRIGVAPMTRTSATEEGLATDQMVSYYTSFARGGFGLIITEGIYPDDKHSQGYFNQPGIPYRQSRRCLEQNYYDFRRNAYCTPCIMTQQGWNFRGYPPGLGGFPRYT